MLGWDFLGQEGHIHVMILNKHLCMSEGVRRFRVEGICFMGRLSVKRRDYHLRLLFFLPFLHYRN